MRGSTCEGPDKRTCVQFKLCTYCDRVERLGLHRRLVAMFPYEHDSLGGSACDMHVKQVHAVIVQPSHSA